MRQYSRGIISYLIFVAVLVGVILLITSVSRKNMEEDYTRAEFVADMEGGKVSSIEIHLNGETPTGSLEIHLKNGSQKKRKRWFDPTDLIPESLTWSGRAGCLPPWFPC